MHTAELSPREKMVLRFISKNAGCSKQTVVNAFKGNYSRVTVFKIITILVDFGLVYTEPNNENRQKYCLFVGGTNLLTRITDDLDSLEKAIDGIVANWYKSGASLDLGCLYDITNLIHEIFSDTVMDFLSCAFWSWPQEVGDKNHRVRNRILERAYFILFSKISEIIAKIIRNYPFDFEEGAPVGAEILSSNYIQISNSIDKLRKIRSISKGTAIAEKVDDLINCIVSIGINEKFGEKTERLKSMLH